MNKFDALTSNENLKEHPNYRRLRITSPQSLTAMLVV